jgi:hypothetical protein
MANVDLSLSGGVEIELSTAREYMLETVSAIFRWTGGDRGGSYSGGSSRLVVFSVTLAATLRGEKLAGEA